MNLDLSDEERALLLRELDGIIDGDRFPLSPRIRTLKAIRAKIPTGAGARALTTEEALRAAPCYRSEKAWGGPLALKSAPCPPMTLGDAAAARVRLIVWCKACQHQVEADPAVMAARYGAETAVPDWRDRLICSQCGSHEIDMVVTGTERRAAS